jgi:hypothetical protein
METAAHYPGDNVVVTGLYRTIHSIAHPTEFGKALKKGSRFPSCAVCGHDVTYLLIETVPEVEDVEDFEKPPSV